MQNKIAIIIPVYNKELYVAECIESILVQSYQNIEVILVDDGSTDGSLNILKAYAQEDRRITILTQENQGPNAARYRGMQTAESQWVTFVDADDYIDKDFIETLVNHSNDTDLVLSNLKSERFGHVYNFIMAGKYDFYQDSYIYNNLFYLGDSNNLTIHQCLPGSLFRKGILEKAFGYMDFHIYFGEDSTLKYLYILESKRISVIDYAGYDYRKRQNSITQSEHSDFLTNMNQRYLCLKKAMEENGCTKRMFREMERFTTFELMRAPRTMGMQDDFAMRYYIPEISKIAGKDIIIYGAGEVGRNYIRQVVGQKIANLVACVDATWSNKKIYMNIEIKSPEKLLEMNFDIILIAASNKDIFDSIRKDIVEMKIPEYKILDQKPLEMTELYKD